MPGGEFHQHYRDPRAVPLSVVLWVALGLVCSVAPGVETVAVRQAGNAERVDRLTFLPPHMAEGTALGRTVEMITGAIGAAATEDAPFAIGPLRDRWTFIARPTEISLPVVRNEASSAWLEGVPVTALTTPILEFSTAAPSSVVVPERAPHLSSRGVVEVVPVRIVPEARFGVVPSRAGELPAIEERVPDAAATDQPGIASAKALPDATGAPVVTKGRHSGSGLRDRSAPGTASKPVSVDEPVRLRRPARSAASASGGPKPTVPWSPFETLNSR